jgi:hypothetical protein
MHAVAWGHSHGMHGACRVIDTVCTVFEIFEKHQKLKIIFGMGLLCKKIKNSHDTACTLHNRPTIQAALTAFKGNIYQKHLYT